MATINAEKLVNYLQEKWGNRPCPMCGVGKWNVQNRAFELREFHGGDFIIGGSPIIPVIPIVCGNCGNTILVNPLIAGIELEGKEKEKKNE